MYNQFVPLDIAVLSPEKTVLTYRLAGLGSRALAHFVDWMLIIVSMYLMFMVGAIISAAFVNVSLDLVAAAVEDCFCSAVHRGYASVCVNL